ncbi:hypothetical protein ACMFMG_003626 [Clarireedia jacksonii]
MYKSTIAALTLMGMASAQVSVVNLNLLGFDDTGNLVGSVIASDKTATTYSITCSGTAAPATTTGFYEDSDNDCGLPPSFTFTQGPSTLQYAYAYSDYESETAWSTYSASSISAQESFLVGCVITDSSLGLCSATDAGNYGVSSFSSVITTSFDNIYTEFTPVPVTITAGAIGSAANTATATAKSSGAKPTGTSGSASGASAASGASGASASKASATASSSTTVLTAGMPMVTAKAQWVVGAAAVIAYAAM